MNAYSLCLHLAKRFPVLKRALPRRARQVVSSWLLDQAMIGFPDRIYMRRHIVPLIRASGVDRVLDVGCRRYSTDLGRLLAASGIEVWTLDVDPEAAEWSAARSHIVGDARYVDTFEELRGFPCIIFNGVIGFGIDSRADIERTFLGLSRTLDSAGMLVFGWNRDLMDAPESYENYHRFHRIGDVVTFPRSTHAYAYLKLAGAPTSS